MTGNVSFKVPRDVMHAIGKACLRYHELRAKHGLPKAHGPALHMDLTACHANGCPVDWAMLLAADDLTFIHDVAGIQRHVNRETGKLEHCFVPRCAASNHE